MEQNELRVRKRPALMMRVETPPSDGSRPPGGVSHSVHSGKNRREKERRQRRPVRPVSGSIPARLTVLRVDGGGGRGHARRLSATPLQSLFDPSRRVALTSSYRTFLSALRPTSRLSRTSLTVLLFLSPSLSPSPSPSPPARCARPPAPICYPPCCRLAASPRRWMR